MKPFVELLPCSKYITGRDLTAEGTKTQDLEGSFHPTTSVKPTPQAFG